MNDLTVRRTNLISLVIVELLGLIISQRLNPVG